MPTKKRSKSLISKSGTKNEQKPTQGIPDKPINLQLENELAITDMPVTDKKELKKLDRIDKRWKRNPDRQLRRVERKIKRGKY